MEKAVTPFIQNYKGFIVSINLIQSLAKNGLESMFSQMRKEGWFS